MITEALLSTIPIAAKPLNRYKSVVFCPESYPNKFSLLILLPFGPTFLVVAAVSDVRG
jgi:hypothetical protein